MKRAPAQKTPKLNIIPNTILKIIIDLLTLDFTALFNTSLTKIYYLKCFKIARTVMLRKNLIKLAYLPNNYRQVALLNTIGKFIEVIII